MSGGGRISPQAALRRTARIRELSAEEAALVLARQVLNRIAYGVEAAVLTPAMAQALIVDRHDQAGRLSTVLRHLAEAAEREAGLHARIDELILAAQGRHE